LEELKLPVAVETEAVFVTDAVVRLSADGYNFGI